MEESINVLGSKLESCSTDPMTGWFRDGCCNTDNRDFGRHVVCVVMTDIFLAFSKGAGNDLSSPGPGFSGLKEGDVISLPLIWKFDMTTLSSVLSLRKPAD